MSINVDEYEECMSMNMNEYYCGWVLMQVSINEKAVTCGLSSTLSLLSRLWAQTESEYYCGWVLLWVSINVSEY